MINNPQIKTTKKIGGISRDAFFKGFKVIFKYLRPYWKNLLILVLFGLINAAAQAFVPLVAGKIFDYIISLSKNIIASLFPVFLFITIWLSLQLGSNIISWRTDSTNAKLGVYPEGEYTVQGLGRLLEMPMSFHANRKQGDAANRIDRAAGWLSSIVTNVLLSLLPNFLSIIVALIITFSINWRLSLILLAAILIYIFILWEAVPGLAALQKKMHRAYNSAYGYTWDILGNIKEIKQAATEKKEQKLMRRNFIERAAQLWVDMNTIFQKLNFSQKVLVTLTQFSIFVSSVFLVRNGTITPGELVAFNGYAAMVLGPFVVLGQN